MTIQFEIPPDLVPEFHADGPDLNQEAKEAYLVNLYREERISHRQLAEALGLSRYETDGLLKRHQVSPNVSGAELSVQAVALRDARPE